MSETREYFQRKYPEFIDDIERRFNFTIGNLPVPTNELEWLDLVKLVYSGASAAKDASIRDYMNICEDLSRKLEEANKAHEKTRAYLGAEINSKAELRNRFDIYVTEANRALTTANEEINLLKIEKKLSNLNADRGFDAKDARIAELETLKGEARFLVDRLREWEADGCDCDRGNREWNGHVSPPLARLEGILSKLEGKSDD